MPEFRIFVSTVSSEFRSYRDALRQPLTRPNVSVKLQEDFIAAGTETLDKLDDYLKHCDAVVHVIGDMTGSFAEPRALESVLARYPDLAARLPALGAALEQGTPISYTQWEAYLAVYHRKKLLIAAPRGETLRDPTFVSDDAQRASQRAHIERLKKLGRHVEIQFENADKLTIEILRSPIFDMLHAAEGSAGVSAERRTRQNELISRHELFGGRQKELAQLDTLLRESSRVLHFVHGPSGFGKTALLANWVNLLQAKGQAVAYQFVNRLEGMADEHFALRNLCEQLAAWHGIVDALPASVDDLRNVYVRLVQRPSLDDRSLVIVLDGLDEATAWSPRALFPTSLARGVHVFFSARVDNDESRNQWLSRLGLSRERVDFLALGRLEPPAIAALLKNAGATASALATDAAFVQAIYDVSAGDPFYLHFLVKDIESGNLTRDTVSEQPGDLWAYFDQWMSQLQEDVDTSLEKVYALVGFLSAALGPLKPMELSSASPILKEGMLLERELSGNLRRYLSGNRNTGYALCHPRFRDFLCSNIFNAEELASYRGQLLEFCRKWREHRSTYALDHYVAHLEEEGNREELYALISKDWKEARVRQTGSPRAFAGDVETAIATALAESPPNVPEAVRCCLVYATIASVVESLPVEALGVLARAGDPGRAPPTRARADAARDYAALIREPVRRTQAYYTIALAVEAAGDKAQALDMLALAFASAERIADAKARASSLLELAEAVQRLAGPGDLLDRIVAVLEGTVVELTDSTMLSGIARFFERTGETQKASEFHERAKTAAEKEKSGFSFDFSGMDFSGLFPEFATSMTVKAICDEADAALKEGRRADALAALARGELTLTSEQDEGPAAVHRPDLWCGLAEAFARAGDRQRAQKCALSAVDEMRAAPDAGHIMLSTAKSQRLIRVANTLVGIGCGEAAEEVARAAAASCVPGDAAYVLNDLAKLATRLCELQRAGGAAQLTGYIIQCAQNAATGGERASALAALALASARQQRREEALDLTQRALRDWTASGDSLLSARVLGTLARARAIADPGTKLEDERSLASQLSGLNRALALALLAGSYSERDLKNEAVACVSELVPLLGPFEQFSDVTAQIVLEAARSMIACGLPGWAIDNANILLPMTSGSGTPGVQARLLGDIASVLSDAGDAQNALKHGMAALQCAVTYNLEFLQNLLPATTTMLCSLGENRRARELLTSACDALQTMKRGSYEFGASFPEIALTAARVADDRALERLRDMSAGLEGSYSLTACWSSLSLALAERGRGAEARDVAARALASAIESLQSKDHGYAMQRSLPRLMEALVRADDQPGIKRLRECMLNLESYDQTPLFCGVLPALGALSDKAAIDEIVAAASALREYARSMVLATASSAFLAMGDRTAAVNSGHDALVAFEAERDGSATPTVLPLLVPALVAIEDVEGLLRLLKMPGGKWPYQREWGPALRLLLPALAELGIDDPDPKAREALSGADKYFAEAERDIAEAQARRGLFDKAAATAASLRSPQRRAEAFVRIARASADQGDNRRAEKNLLAAAASLPVLQNDVVVLGEMALLAVRIDASQRLRQELKRAFLRSTERNLVAIDTDIFAHAVVPLAKAGNEQMLSEIAAIVDAAGDAEQKARSGASLVFALAKAGRFGECEARRKRTTQVIADLPDVAQKAAPLCDVAKALTLEGRHDAGRDVLLQALNAARRLGRASFLKIVEEGADAACSFERACVQIADAIVRADALWLSDAAPAAEAETSRTQVTK